VFCGHMAPTTGQMTPHRVVIEREASDLTDFQPRDPIIYSRVITFAASRNASDIRIGCSPARMTLLDLLKRFVKWGNTRVNP
jgi:hypothetical protein